MTTEVDRRGKGSPYSVHTVPSFDLRGGSCGVTIWGGCVDDDAAVVVAAAGAAAEDWLMLVLVCDDLVIAVVPEPDPGDAADGVEGLAPFRAVGVFGLPPPLEEASRWSSALSASALQQEPTHPPQCVSCRLSGKGSRRQFEMRHFAKTSTHTSVVQLRHVLPPVPSLVRVHNPPIRGPQIAKKVV